MLKWGGSKFVPLALSQLHNHRSNLEGLYHIPTLKKKTMNQKEGKDGCVLQGVWAFIEQSTDCGDRFHSVPLYSVHRESSFWDYRLTSMVWDFTEMDPMLEKLSQSSKCPGISTKYTGEDGWTAAFLAPWLGRKRWNGPGKHTEFRSGAGSVGYRAIDPWAIDPTLPSPPVSSNQFRGQCSISQQSVTHAYRQAATYLETQATPGPKDAGNAYYRPCLCASAQMTPLLEGLIMFWQRWYTGLTVKDALH